MEKISQFCVVTALPYIKELPCIKCTGSSLNLRAGVDVVAKKKALGHAMT